MLWTIGLIVVTYIIGVVIDYNTYSTTFTDACGRVTFVRRQATKEEAWYSVLWPWYICAYFLNKAAILAAILAMGVVRFFYVLFEKDSN